MTCVGWAWCLMWGQRLTVLKALAAATSHRLAWGGFSWAELSGLTVRRDGWWVGLCAAGGAHRRVPLAAAFDHVLAECGYSGGDAAIGTNGPTHWDGGLDVLGGLRDALAGNSFAVLLPCWGVNAGCTNLERCFACGREGCACWGCPAGDNGRWAGTSSARMW